jgi:hypothetical protein
MHYQFSTTDYLCRDTTHCLSTFLCRLERELRRGTEVRAIWMNFDAQGFLTSQFNYVIMLSWLCTTTTLRRVTIEDARQGRVVASTILKALCCRTPTMPNLDELTFSSVDLTAEDFEHVLKICRPECFMFRWSTILISPTIPTNAAALDHVTSALWGTSTIMKSITVSALDGSDMCLRAILQGVENHENLTTTVLGCICSLTRDMSRKLCR